jgi:DNA-binding GntR family transcriptional regulator
MIFMESSVIEKEFSPQYSVPLVEQISEFLTNAIIEGRLENGQRLIENDLQRKFGVSRAPIRESFRILEKKGLVTIISRKGTFVRKITQKDVEENFPIRAVLEGLAARMAISHLTLKDIEGMELALSKMTEAARKIDFKSYLKYHLEYHEIFINASKNDTLIGILEKVRRQALWFFRFSYLWHEEIFGYPIRAHREILDFFLKKDADSAGKLVEQHILIALDEYLKFLASRTSK